MINNIYCELYSKYILLIIYIMNYEKKYFKYKNKYLKLKKNQIAGDKEYLKSVAGKEYLNKAGYTTYDMWLPKAENRKYAFGEVEGGKVIPYEESKYLKKLEVKDVNNFGGDDEFSKGGTTSSDFSLD